MFSIKPLYYLYILCMITYFHSEDLCVFSNWIGVVFIYQLSSLYYRIVKIVKRFLSSPPWLLQSFKPPLFVFWSIKWSLPPVSSYCHLIDFFLKHGSDHISLLKILQWFHCLQANIHIFQHDLKALHWSGTNLPAPSFPIISQLHSLPLKYITPLYICSCCSLQIEHLTQFVPLISSKL